MTSIDDEGADGTWHDESDWEIGSETPWTTLRSSPGRHRWWRSSAGPTSASRRW